jgi:hypothetical protein
VIAEPKRPTLPATPKQPTTATIEREEDQQELFAAESEADLTEENVPAGGESGPKRSYNFKSPTFLNSLDLSKATKPLEEFVEEKKPTDVMDKYLVILFWLQKHLSVEEVTVDHIYTVFDHLGWKGEMPLKASKPLSDLKSKRHVITRDDGATGYKLNFKGEQYVERMASKK